MKKLLSLACTLLLLLSCEEKEGSGGGTAVTPATGSDYLNVSSTNIDIASNATTASLTISASPSCDWTITWDKAQTWIQSVQPVSGRGTQTVTITVSENKTAQENSAELTISSSNANIPPRSVTIRQNAGAPSLKVDKTQLSFDENGGTESFLVTSNIAWRLSYSDPDKWVQTETSADGKVSVTVGRAVSSSSRELTIYIMPEDDHVTVDILPSVVVRQSGLPEISFKADPKELTFGCVAGAPQTVGIESNAKWELTQAAVAGGNTDWLKVEPASGTGNGTITVTCQDNTTLSNRQVVVMIIPGGDISKATNVSIVQEAGRLPEVGSLTAKGDVRYIKDYAEFTMSYQSVFPVTAYGLCYSTTNQEPTLSDEHTTVTGTGTSALDVSLKTGQLQALQTYYVRAYATSAVGTQYSSQTITLNTVGDAPTTGDNPPLFVRKKNK